MEKQNGNLSGPDFEEPETEEAPEADAAAVTDPAPEPENVTPTDPPAWRRREDFNERVPENWVSLKFNTICILANQNFKAWVFKSEIHSFFFPY